MEVEQNRKVVYRLLWIGLFIFFGMIGSVYSQTRTITGKVTDGTHPLPGVTITVMGTTVGTISDFDGNYEVTAETGTVIEFSYIGFTTTTRTVGTEEVINVELTEDAQSLGEVVLVGSRAQPRTALESPVPVDVIDVKQISDLTGQISVNQLLQLAGPSFNANNQSGSDQSDAVNAATLRGLGPDQTLVLLNGKRYHQSSLIFLFGTRGRGNTGTDMNSIPVGAIKRIEVLRDGAAAQYGSDAIAGVINIVLNDRDHGFEGDMFYGANLFHDPGDNDVISKKKIDGNTFNFSGNLGTKIGKKGGFGNFTLEYVNKQHYFRIPNMDKYPVYRRQFGGPKSDSFYFFGNIEIPLSDNLTFYSQQGYSFRDTKSFAWSRSAGADNNIDEVYPNGYDPIINSKVDDVTFNNGIKFDVSGWDVDVYNAFGYNRFKVDVDNTINATLGPNSPTEFYAGGHALAQNTTGFSATKGFDSVLKGLNIAFGSEFRWEGYKLMKGEEGSFALYDINGNVVDENTPASLLVTNPLTGNIRPSGSQGFSGFNSSVSKHRTNASAFIDTELDITDDWMISGALRYEHYSDFGNVLAGKFSTRYSISPVLSLRGSVSNGFRAPSLAQRFFQLQFIDIEQGDLISVLLSPNGGDLANAVGIPDLKEEKSLNTSAGFTISTRKFKATVDGYFVDIKDRIVLTGQFDRSILLDATGGTGVPIDLEQAQFFANSIDTRSYGLDVILTYNTDIGEGKLTSTLAGNYNHMKILNVNASPELAGFEDIYVSEQERSFILASAPKTKYNLNLNYQLDRFSTNLQMTRFGKLRLNNSTGDQIYTPRITTDLSFGYELTKNTTLYLGGTNIFNRYPTLQKEPLLNGGMEGGGIFSAVQMGYEGRQAFARIVVKL